MRILWSPVRFGFARENIFRLVAFSFLITTKIFESLKNINLNNKYLLLFRN